MKLLRTNLFQLFWAGHIAWPELQSCLVGVLAKKFQSKTRNGISDYGTDQERWMRLKVGAATMDVETFRIQSTGQQQASSLSLQALHCSIVHRTAVLMRASCFIARWIFNECIQLVVQIVRGITYLFALLNCWCRILDVRDGRAWDAESLLPWGRWMLYVSTPLHPMIYGK